MARSDAPGGGVGRGFCLERQDLPKPYQDRVRDHGHPLGWSQILRLAGQIAGRTSDMTKPTPKPVRCAIYTRVSTDQGLEQDFNSLDAQYDAAKYPDFQSPGISCSQCAAVIASSLTCGLHLWRCRP